MKSSCFVWIAALVFVAACAPKDLPLPNEDDPSVDAAYQGDTVGGAIPDNDAPPEPVDDDSDAGFVVDTTCCEATFTISDEEPADATGRVRGNFGPLAGDGVPLTREGGEWTASACMPLDGPTLYWFEFSEPGGDGGTTVDRYSDAEPHDNFGDQGTLNVYSACTSLDGGTAGQP